MLVPLESSDELAEVSLADGNVVSRTGGIGRQPHDAVRTSDGTVVVTNEMGGGVVFVRDGAVVGSLPAGPPQPGGGAAVGKYAAVADVQGNGVWVYDGSTREQVAQGPVGTKLTHVTLTATNQLQVIDVADPATPRIAGTVPTVQQLNSVAVEPRSGAVLITGSSPNGSLQIIT